MVIIAKFIEKVLSQFLITLCGGFRFSHLWFDRSMDALLATFGVKWLLSAASTLTRFRGKINFSNQTFVNLEKISYKVRRVLCDSRGARFPQHDPIYEPKSFQQKRNLSNTSNIALEIFRHRRLIGGKRSKKNPATFGDRPETAFEKQINRMPFSFNCIAVHHL